jgi:hypothetical protein
MIHFLLGYFNYRVILWDIDWLTRLAVQNWVSGWTP